jgi:hypothetical protein
VYVAGYRHVLRPEGQEGYTRARPNLISGHKHGVRRTSAPGDVRCLRWRTASNPNRAPGTEDDSCAEKSVSSGWDEKKRRVRDAFTADLRGNGLCARAA